jgi:small neutral amino acid transporter SnatA (MarC family)
MRPQPELQAAFAEGVGLEVVVALMAGLVSSHRQHDALLACLCSVLAAAVTGSTKAQDQVRLAGGIDVVVAALKQHLDSCSSTGKQVKQQQLHAPDLAPVACPLLQLLAVLVADNAANKLALREAGTFACVAVLLDALLVTHDGTAE